MKLELRILPKLELKLQQAIDTSNLLDLTDEALDAVSKAISNKPDEIEQVLQKRKRDSNPEGNSNKVRLIYSSLEPPKTSSGQSGIIISPDIRLLEPHLGSYQKALTPDVTYIARKDNKPEVVFSNNLAEAKSLKMIQINPAQYPETSKLLSHLRRFDEWKKEKLREGYVVLGEEQREFFEDFDCSRLHLFVQKDLAKKIKTSRGTISRGTISRLLSDRLVEARDISGREKIIYAKNLLASLEDITRYAALPILNEIFKEELKTGVACSDEEISERVPEIARRTVTKYRTMSGIPIASRRTRIYGAGLKEPYKVEVNLAEKCLA